MCQINHLFMVSIVEEMSSEQITFFGDRIHKPVSVFHREAAPLYGFFLLYIYIYNKIYMCV